MKVLIVISFLILFGCKENKCSVNETFESTFIEMRNSIVTSYKEQGGLNNNAVRGVFYLQDITGIRSKSIIGELSYYNSESDYKADIRNWNSWYSKHKCSVSKEESNNSLENVMKSTQWMN